MDEETINRIISTVPDAKRSAQGVVFPTGDGGLFHLLGIQDSAETAGLTDDEKFFVGFCAKKEILRLREMKNPHDYLLRLRANAIVNSPRLVRVMAARKSEYEKLDRVWSLTHYYHSKDSYHKSYIDNLQKGNAKITKKVPSGLTFSTEVNAMCIRSFVGDVVIASENLEHFYYFMTIAFYGQSLGIKFIDRADALIIAVRLILGSEALDFDIDPRGILDDTTERKVRQLVQNQMKFTFGHEYAHLLRGHLSEPDMIIKINAFPNTLENEQKLKVYNHQLEFEADIFAVKNVERDHNTFTAVSHGALSVLIYLHFIEAVSVFCKMPEFSVSITHPTPTRRIENLQKGLGSKSPLSEEMIADAFHTSKNMEKIFYHRVLKSDRDDILTFYGSIYMPSYTQKVKRDRYDF